MRARRASRGSTSDPLYVRYHDEERVCGNGIRAGRFSSTVRRMFLPSLLLAASLASVAAKPGDPAPPAYALLTLRSGHVFRVLNSGPLLDAKGQRLALALSYLSSARTQKEVQAAAEELFEYLRPHAENEKDKAVVVIARLGSGSEAVDQDVLYERQTSGKWKRSARPMKSLPSPAASPSEEERDVAGSRVAKQ